MVDIKLSNIMPTQAIFESVTYFSKWFINLHGYSWWIMQRHLVEDIW